MHMLASREQNAAYLLAFFYTRCKNEHTFYGFCVLYANKGIPSNVFAQSKHRKTYPPMLFIDLCGATYKKSIPSTIFVASHPYAKLADPLAFLHRTMQKS